MVMKENFDLKNDIEAFLESEGLTLDEFANQLGVSRPTLFSAMSSNEATPRLLEAVYRYLFAHGYRLNQALEEIFTETRDKNHIVLYHGAKHELKDILPRGSRPECDFGPGFYLGESYHSAASFVFVFPESSIYVFDADFTGLNILEYGNDLEWMLSICYHRGYLGSFVNHVKTKRLLQKEESCDLILAPIADNKMFQIIREFAIGEISSEMAMHALSASRLGKQYVLKTDKAVARLSFLKRLYLSEPEREVFQAEGLERAKLIDSKLKLAKRTFRDGGSYIEDLFNEKPE